MEVGTSPHCRRASRSISPLESTYAPSSADMLEDTLEPCPPPIVTGLTVVAEEQNRPPTFGGQGQDGVGLYWTTLGVGTGESVTMHITPLA